MVMLCDCYVIVLFELDQREWHAMAYYHNWRRKTAMMTGVLHGKENKAADRWLNPVDCSSSRDGCVRRLCWCNTARQMGGTQFPAFLQIPSVSIQYIPWLYNIINYIHVVWYTCDVYHIYAKWIRTKLSSAGSQLPGANDVLDEIARKAVGDAKGIEGISVLLEGYPNGVPESGWITLLRKMVVMIWQFRVTNDE